MDSKLTLKLDQGIIENAKLFAKQNNISLSRLIENYLHAITKSKFKATNVSLLVESLTGVVDFTDEDYRKDYTNYLSNKHS